MITRTLIGILREDRQVEYISILEDDQKNLQMKLKSEYKTQEKVNELIGQGDCSFFGTPKIYNRSETWVMVKPKVKTLMKFANGGTEDYRYLFNPKDRTWKFKQQQDFKFKRV